MNADTLNRSNHNLVSLFRFRKEEDLTAKGWVDIPSSRSWTLDDKLSGGDELKASSVHSRAFFKKVGRTKSMEEALRPMASLSQALTKLPRASLANMRSVSFRNVRADVPLQEDNLATPEEDDDSTGDSFHYDTADDDEKTLDVAILNIIPPSRQEGTLIRRRREKQLSKGRRSLRRTPVRTNSSDSTHSWEKFLEYASAPESDEM